jgi:hypothetical protein
VTTSKQLDFNENFFPYRKEELIKQLDESDDKVNLLFKALAPITWLKYDPSMNLITFTKMHTSMGSGRNLILQSPTDQYTFLKIEQETFFKNLLIKTTIYDKRVKISAHLPNGIPVWDLLLWVRSESDSPITDRSIHIPED